jgi:hypothetical protein
LCIWEEGWWEDGFGGVFHGLWVKERVLCMGSIGGEGEVEVYFTPEGDFIGFERLNVLLYFLARIT